MRQTPKWTTHADLAINKACTVTRDEYLAHMTFETNERPLFTEIFGPIVGLKEEWEQQGATSEELDFSAFCYRCEHRGWIPVNTGLLGNDPPRVVDETDTYILSRDSLGRTLKLMKGRSTLPLPLDYPVRTMEDWLQIKPRYQFSEERFGRGWQRAAHEHRAAGRVVGVTIPGGFDEPRQLLGEEQLCLAYYDQPKLVHDIVATICNTAFQVLERVSSAFQVDLLFVHEDLAGKSGPLAGPSQFDHFIGPYYRRIWELLASRGTRLFDFDSDGDINALIPCLLEAGVNCIHPMEAAAGMDIVQIRKQYGRRLAFYGGIDKHVLRRTREEIGAELAYKIPPMIATGGCVLALDHRIPNGTPLEHYRFYVRKVWELIAQPSAAEEAD
jgi:hypothetical protein